MYVEHPLLKRYPDDTHLWRYMDFTKFVSLLERSALHFCRADLLGDPFEGSISAVSPPAFPPQPPEHPIQIQAVDLRSVVHSSFVNCWHAAPYESAAMWRLYARERDGIAVRTDYESFCTAFVCERQISVGRMEYVDYSKTNIPFGNALLPLFHKRESFRHEHEVRALVFGTNEERTSAITGCYCEVDLHRLITELVVAPFADAWFFELVSTITKRYDLNVEVRKSALTQTPNFTARFVIPSEQ